MEGIFHDINLCGSQCFFNRQMDTLEDRQLNKFHRRVLLFNFLSCPIIFASVSSPDNLTHDIMIHYFWGWSVVDRQLHDHPQHNDNREIKILIKFAQPFLNEEGQKKRKKDVSK